MLYALFLGKSAQGILIHFIKIPCKNVVNLRLAKHHIMNIVNFKYQCSLPVLLMALEIICKLLKLTIKKFDSQLSSFVVCEETFLVLQHLIAHQSSGLHPKAFFIKLPCQFATHCLALLLPVCVENNNHHV